MTRPVGAAAALLSLASSALGTLDRPKRAVRTDATTRLAVASRPNPPEAVEVVPPAEVGLTEHTEVVLDGRPCRYRDIPPTAVVARMTLAADGRTVMKIEFRTRR